MKELSYPNWIPAAEQQPGAASSSLRDRLNGHFRFHRSRPNDGAQAARGKGVRHGTQRESRAGLQRFCVRLTWA